MSGLGWQDLGVAVVMVGAVGYLVRRQLAARRRGATCEGCPGCGTSSSANAAATRPEASAGPARIQLIQIEHAAPHGPRAR